MFRNVNQHDIWNDMGLSRMMGIQFEKSFSFLIKNGRAEDFLRDVYKRQTPVSGPFEIYEEVASINL